LEVQPFGVFSVRNIYDYYDNSISDSFEKQYWVLAPFPEQVFYDMKTATTITMSNQAEWNNWCAILFNTVGLKKNASDIGTDRSKPYRTNSQLTQNAIINTAHFTFWIAHQKYCSLDDVDIP
jgi:hypothetical protein